MSVVQAQRSLCAELSGTAGLETRQPNGANAKAAVNLTHPRRDCDGSGFTTATSGPVGSSPAGENYNAP